MTDLLGVEKLPVTCAENTKDRKSHKLRAKPRDLQFRGPFLEMFSTVVPLTGNPGNGSFRSIPVSRLVFTDDRSGFSLGPQLAVTANALVDPCRWIYVSTVITARANRANKSLAFLRPSAPSEHHLESCQTPAPPAARPDGFPSSSPPLPPGGRLF